MTWWLRRRRTRHAGAGEAAASGAATHAFPIEDWVRPWALRQEPSGADAAPVTRIGTIDGPALAGVDARGLVTPGGATWSLDWWVGADDRWHVPSQEFAVRQHSVDGAPVVVTSMRVPGGDAVQRVYTARVPDGHAVVVEVENQSAVPFALAWALRPFVALAPTVASGAVGRIRRASVDGSVVTVDGMPAVVLDRKPGRAATGTGAEGDLAARVFAGEAGPVAPSVECPGGLAQAAAVVPVPHRATVRAVVPLGVEAPFVSEFPPVLPSATDVAAGWSAHAGSGARYVLPEGRLAGAAARARRRLLLGATEGGTRAPALPARADPLLLASVIDALVGCGHDAEAARLLASWFLQSPTSIGAAAPATVALHRYWTVRRDDELVRAAREPIRDAVSAVADQLSRRGRELPPALHAWGAAAMAAGAELLASIGDQRAGRDAAVTADHAAHQRDQVLEAFDSRADRPAAIALAAAASLGALPARHPAVRTFVRSFQDGRECQTPSGPTGPSDELLTIDLATLATAAGGRGSYDRLTDVAGRASATGAWADGGDRDLAISARLLRAAHRLLVIDRSDPSDTEGGAHGAAACVCPAWPDAWQGQGVEAHGVPVGGASLSFAVRWHGPRPALLWEVTGGGLTLTTGLDPAWRTTEPQGEALLHDPTATSSRGRPESMPARPASCPDPTSRPDRPAGPSPGGGSFT